MTFPPDMAARHTEQSTPEPAPPADKEKHMVTVHSGTDAALSPHWRILLAGINDGAWSSGLGDAPDPVVLVAGDARPPARLPFVKVTSVGELTEVIAACALSPNKRRDELGCPVGTLVIATLDAVDQLLGARPEKLRMVLASLATLPVNVLLLSHLRREDGHYVPDLSVGAAVGSLVDMALLARPSLGTTLVQAYADDLNPWIVDHTATLPHLGGLTRALKARGAETALPEPAAPTADVEPSAPAKPAAKRKPRAATPPPAPVVEAVVEDLADEDSEGDDAERPPCGNCGAEISDDAWDLTTIRRQYVIKPGGDTEGTPLCGKCGKAAWETAAAAKAVPRRKVRPAPAQPSGADPAPGVVATRDPGGGSDVAVVPHGEVVGRIVSRDPVMARALESDTGWTGTQPSTDDLRRMLES